MVLARGVTTSLLPDCHLNPTHMPWFGTLPFQPLFDKKFCEIPLTEMLITVYSGVLNKEARTHYLWVGFLIIYCSACRRQVFCP